MKIENKLTIPTRKWVFTDFDLSEAFAKDLLASIEDTNYYGVSANQCGNEYRVIALRSYPESFVCFNPRIVHMSDDNTVVLDEVCASNPGITCKVRRYHEIRVRFEGPDGQTYSKTFTGLTSRIFQQLMDNLDGVVFYARANRYHREKALKKKGK